VTDTATTAGIIASGAFGHLFLFLGGVLMKECSEGYGYPTTFETV